MVAFSRLLVLFSAVCFAAHAQELMQGDMPYVPLEGDTAPPPSASTLINDGMISFFRGRSVGSPLLSTSGSAPKTPDATGGSYHVETVNKDMATEVARLRQQAVMWFPREKKAFRRAGLRGPMKVADIGCGPGFLSHEIIAAFPGVSVTGVELDPKLLQVADRTNKAAGARWTGKQGSIDAIPLPDASVDMVFVRYVVQHLPQPVRALKEVMRVLKPGGKLVVIDIDEQLSGIFAPGPAFKKAYAAPDSPLQAGMAANQVIAKLFDTTQRAEGGDRNIGRRLWGLMNEAGYHSVSLSTQMIGSPELGLPAFRKLMMPDARAWKFFRKGKISKAQLEANEGMLDAFFSDKDSLIYDMEWIIVGTKPGRKPPATTTTTTTATTATHAAVTPAAAKKPAAPAKK